MKKIPVGISTLAAIREEDMVYIDKTDLALKMIGQPARIFLSRPRRFGKSLFVDTLKEIFEGNQDLFKGLHIHDKWDWSRKFPVIKFDFADGVIQSRMELDKRIWKSLQMNATRLGVLYDTETDIPGALADIIQASEERYGQKVVVLVDEYDKPILDNIDAPATAAEMREGLKNLYSVLKGQDAHLQFIFMTGVSKFSKVSLFSGVNQLEDISLDPEYSHICGYTPADVEFHFTDHLKGVDRDDLRRWYNGYNWTGEERVYNPYDILLFIQKNRRFQNFWFETGNPTFLIKLFRKYRYFLPDLEGIRATEEILGSFDVEIIDPVTLLFQTGYLTVDRVEYRRSRQIYCLKIPNQEVRIALNDSLINSYTAWAPSEKIPHQDHLYDVLATGDLPGISNAITRLFASIPWRNFTNNDLADFEGYYASVLYAFFASLNAQIIPEDITNRGQADLTVILENRIYVMEIKVVDGEGEPLGDDLKSMENPALAQIQERDYAEKYRGRPGMTIHELGLIFSRKTRNLIRADAAPFVSDAEYEEK